MAEYIERDALLQDIESSVRITSKTGMINPETRGAYKIIERIKSAAAADVVEVVRCKECKYWQDNNGGYPNDECRWGNGETPDPDDFCSYRKRKEGADNG